MQVQSFFEAGVQVGLHHRSPLDDEADVADEGLVQDRVHGLPVVGHALGVARRRGVWGLGIRAGHPPIVSVLAQLAASRASHCGIVHRNTYAHAELRMFRRTPNECLSASSLAMADGENRDR